MKTHKLETYTTFTNIIKPTSQCNLNCIYCYNRSYSEDTMTESTLQRVIDETFLYCSSKNKEAVINFIWHGGEPLLLPLDFYRQALNLQKKLHRGMQYRNSFQTNGTGINKEWIDFLQDNDCEIAISLDGPKPIHDRGRIDQYGDGTFDLIMKKINLLRKAKIDVRVCVVMYKEMYGKEAELYDFFAKEQLPFRMIELNKCGFAEKYYNALTLSPKEYAEIWIKLFDIWSTASNEKYILCVNFVDAIAALMSGKSLLCSSKRTCSNNIISTAPDGSVYPCATFTSDQKWCYGNLNTNSLEVLMESDIYQKMHARDTGCNKCSWQSVCYGGCPSRALHYGGSINKRDYFCASNKKIFAHVANFLSSSSIAKTFQADMLHQQMGEKL